MRRDLRTYLWDMQKALAEIKQFISGKTQGEYEQDRILLLAIEREFTIIGEVMSRIIHYFPETKARLDSARKIANFRNSLVHEYHVIDQDKVWQMLTVSAPILKQQVDEWLEELDRQQL